MTSANEMCSSVFEMLAWKATKAAQLRDTNAEKRPVNWRRILTGLQIRSSPATGKKTASLTHYLASILSTQDRFSGFALG